MRRRTCVVSISMRLSGFPGRTSTARFSVPLSSTRVGLLHGERLHEHRLALRHPEGDAHAIRVTLCARVTSGVDLGLAIAAPVVVHLDAHDIARELDVVERACVVHEMRFREQAERLEQEALAARRPASRVRCSCPLLSIDLRHPDELDGVHDGMRAVLGRGVLRQNSPRDDNNARRANTRTKCARQQRTGTAHGGP